MSASHGHAGRPPENPLPGAAAALDRAVSRGLAAVTGGALGRYQSAVVRIGMASTWLLFLLREFPHRDQLYGPGSAWGPDLAKSLIAGNHAFTVLLWNDGRGWFELCYALAVAASATLLLGWRTRTSALMFMIGVLSLQNRSVFMGDGGDNVVHIMAIYLAFTRCGQVWSLDSRRARRRAEASAAAADPADLAAPADPAHASGAAVAEPADPVGIALWVVLGGALVAATLAGRLSTGWGLVFWGCLAGQLLWWAVRRYAPGEPRTVMDIMGNVVHNGAMLVLAAEVCLVYSTAGWYKIQGSRWQDGTALYYPLHLDDFTPWPALSHALAGNGVLVMIISYGTVIVQVAFPFTLFNRRVKNVLLVGMMLEHASIAVVLGLPFFSLAMIAADAVFLPTGFLLWLGWRLTSRPGRGAEARGALAGVPGPRPSGDGAAGPEPGPGSELDPVPGPPGHTALDPADGTPPPGPAPA